MAAFKPTNPFLSRQFESKVVPAFTRRCDGDINRATGTKICPSCGNLSRWVLLRVVRVCRCLIRHRLYVLAVMVFAMTIVSLRSKIGEDEYAAETNGGRGERYIPTRKVDHAVNGSSKIVAATQVDKSQPSKVLDGAQVNKPRPTLPSIVAREKTVPRPSNATQTPNVTMAICYFAKTYANHYPSSRPKLYKYLKELWKRKWIPNGTSTQQFRDDIRAALGEAGKSENVYLTKENTPRGAEMVFYMSGRPRSIANSLWDTLPDDSMFQPGRFKVCSVVGSSGILSGSRCGSEIDQAEFVLRFNLAPVRGFEEDVGTKTNFTSMNPTLLKRKFHYIKRKHDAGNFTRWLRQFQGSYLYLPGFSKSASLGLLVKAAKVAGIAGVVKPIYGSPFHFLTVSNLWRKTLDTGTKWPSTGMYAVSSIFDVCDRINVYGFWPYVRSLKGKKVPYHYNNKIRGTKVHNFDREFKTLMLLHEKGIVHVELDSC